MDEYQEWGIQLVYDDNLDCRFRVMGLLANIALEASEDFIPYYNEILVDTGYNSLAIQIPEAVIDVITNTQKDTPIGKLVIIDGLLSSSVKPIRNMITGTLHQCRQGLLFADSFQLLGELDNVGGVDVDIDENLL